jgi:hypothetical protein
MTAAVALASATGADAASDFMDTAQVVSSKPIIERVAEQRQECDPIVEPRRSNNPGPIIGGVLGGLLDTKSARARADSRHDSRRRRRRCRRHGDRQLQCAQPAQQCRTINPVVKSSMATTSFTATTGVM